MPHAIVYRINVNPQGGVPRYAIAQTEITFAGVRGDRQKDRQHHGGSLQTVSLYALELIHALRAEDHPIDVGTTGENLTLQGLDWARVQIGDQLAIGERVLLEITDYATPCKTIAASFTDQQFKRISHKLYPGWSRLYARVLCEGTVRSGDPVELA